MRSPERSLGWLGWTVLLVAVLGLIYYLLFPIPIGGHSKESARRAQTLSNLKQVGQSLILYLADSDERYPPEMSSVWLVEKYIRPYIKPSLTEYEYLHKSLNHSSPEFLGNGSLACKLTREVIKPDQTLLFFDSAPWENGTRVVSYTDSHDGVVKESRFQAALANNWLDAQESSHN